MSIPKISQHRQQGINSGRKILACALVSLEQILYNRACRITGYRIPGRHSRCPIHFALTPTGNSRMHQRRDHQQPQPPGRHRSPLAGRICRALSQQCSPVPVMHCHGPSQHKQLMPACQNPVAFDRFEDQQDTWKKAKHGASLEEHR